MRKIWVILMIGKSGRPLVESAWCCESWAHDHCEAMNEQAKDAKDDIRYSVEPVYLDLND